MQFTKKSVDFNDAQCVFVIVIVSGKKNIHFDDQTGGCIISVSSPYTELKPSPSAKFGFYKIMFCFLSLWSMCLKFQPTFFGFGKPNRNTRTEISTDNKGKMLTAISLIKEPAYALHIHLLLCEKQCWNLTIIRPHLSHTCAKSNIGTHSFCC